MQEKYLKIKQACLEAKTTDPVKLICDIMKKEYISMHGPEHHVLDGACFLTAMYNAGMVLDLDKALDEMIKRGSEMPGATCGMWGVCGSAASIGAALSIINGSGPLSSDEHYKENLEYVSQALGDIAESGGPRCCKRNAFTAMSRAIDFVKQKYGIELVKNYIRCSFSVQNLQCIKEKCPYHSKYFELSNSVQNQTQRSVSMNSYGLVLAGGGGKGAYQIGAWKAMSEMGITFSAIAGVSIGSINGALIAAGDYEKADLMWHSVSIDKGIKITEALPDAENLFSRKNWGTLFKEFIKKGGIDASPVESFIAQFVDEKKVRESGIPLGMITVQMTQGVTPLEIFVDEIPDGLLIDYLLASSNIPLAMGIGPDGEKFLDGGVYDNTPVTTLKKRGYNRLIVVDISNIKGVAHNLDFLNSEVVYIRPYDMDSLGAAFDFDAQTIDRRMILGYLDTKKAFSLLSGKIYYFMPEVFKTMVKDIGADLLQKAEEFAWELGVEQTEIYTQQAFFTALKNAYEQEKIHQEEKDGEGESEDSSRFSKFKKRFSQKKSSDDYVDVIAYLDNLII